jgi:AcrR family transcriptional regulator
MSGIVRLLLVALALALAVATPAAAVDADELAQQLRSDPVLVADDSAIEPDQDALREALRGLPVPTYVVVLPQSAVDEEDSGIDGVLLRVVEAMDDPRAVVVVVTDGGELQAGEGGSSGVDASAELDRIVQERSDQDFDGQTLTAALLAFADRVEQQGEEGGKRGITSSPRQAIGVAGLLAVVLLGGGLLWARSQGKARRQAPLTDTGGDQGQW